MSDAINPSHYKRLPAEAIEIIESAIQNAPDNIAAYNHGQQLKYDLRLFEKGKTLREYLIDQEKHCWYSDRLREHLRKLVEQEDKCEQQKAADLQSLKEHPFGKLKTAPLNSDKIPEGYRKLNDSSEEPRQLGDLRWSVAEKRYIEISVDEIGYANRDNWAACRKVESVVTQSLNTEPPEGWRWLKVGEILRRLDATFNSNGSLYELNQEKAGRTVTAPNVFIRRNRFEVGEKVIDCRAEVVFTVQHFDKEHQIVFVDGVYNGIESKHLAPYTEEAKPTEEITGEVKPPDGWRFLEVGEVIRKGDEGFENGRFYAIEPIKLGMTLQAHWRPVIRRNRFEIGEKVVYIQDESVWDYISEINDGPNYPKSAHVASGSTSLRVCVTRLAPYIEDAT